MNQDLKNTFMLKCLNEYFIEVEKVMKLVAAKKKIGVTGEAMKSIAFNALQNGNSAKGSLSFKEYLRFVDMGVGRGHPLGGLKGMKVVLTHKRLEGIAQVKDNTRKPKKVYSKTAYGKLGNLYGKLLYGFTEETIAALKLEMEQKN